MEKTGINISEALRKVQDSGEFVTNDTAANNNQIQEFLKSLSATISDLIDQIQKTLNFEIPDQFNDSGLLHSLTQFLVWGAVIVIILCLLILLYLHLNKYKKTETEAFKEQFRILSGKLDSKSWLDRATNQAINKDFREACRSIYMSLLLYLDENKIIKYDKTKTNLEYLRTVRNNKELYTPLKGIVNVFEILWYGNNPGSENDFQNCMKLYKEAINE